MSAAKKDADYLLVKRAEDGSWLAHELEGEPGAFVSFPEKASAWKPYEGPSKPKTAKEE